eukprot:10539528-Prorocentrum_lima.AAC.1
MEPDKQSTLCLSTRPIGPERIFYMMAEGLRGMEPWSNDALSEIVNSLLLLFDVDSAMRMFAESGRK